MQLSISVALLPKLLPARWTGRRSIAVVIDTLRFSSTACVALAAGAKGLTVVSDIEQARRVAGSVPDGAALLCGERACVRIPGFDLGNSPAEYVAATVKNRELIFSTTNGTVAVEASQAAQEVVLGSLLNRSALCRWLADSAQQNAADGEPLEVWFVCAGTDGQVALEDVLTAGAIMEGLVATAPKCLLGNDSSALALAAWEDVAREGDDGDMDEAGQTLSSRLLASMCMSLGGHNLIEAGFEGDLRLVAAVDSLAVIPRQESACRFVL
jgi:2-phosphosulfolactate phosphatase